MALRFSEPPEVRGEPVPCRNTGVGVASPAAILLLDDGRPCDLTPLREVSATAVDQWRDPSTPTTEDRRPGDGRLLPIVEALRVKSELSSAKTSARAPPPGTCGGDC